MYGVICGPYIDADIDDYAAKKALPSITTQSQHAKIDVLEAEMRLMPPYEAHVEHFFTDDQYCRKIYMHAGKMITSKIHLTRHPFFVLQGKAAVWDAENGVQIVQAPYFGITQPGTRRVLLIAEDSIWVTVHKCENETIEEIEARIIEPRNCVENSEEFLQIDSDIQKLLSDALQNEV